MIRSGQEFINNRSEIHGQRFDADSGIKLGENFRITDVGRPLPNRLLSIFRAFHPAIAYNSTENQFLLVWSGSAPGLDGQDWEIYGLRLDGNSGVPIGTRFRISNQGPEGKHRYHTRNPSLAYNSLENEYFVVWQGVNSLSNPFGGTQILSIYGQRLNGSSGEEIGEDITINSLATGGG